jgi:hypothetical protein
VTEQLRTIHLTLLLICLVLLAASFADQRGPLKRAYEQVQLIEALSLKNNDVTSILLSQAASRFPSEDSEHEASSKQIASFPYVRLSMNGAPLWTIKRTDRFLYGWKNREREDNLNPLLPSSSITSWDTLGDFVATWQSSLIVIENPLLWQRFDKRQILTSSCGPVTLEPSATSEPGTFGNPFIYDSDAHKVGIHAFFESHSKQTCDVNLWFGTEENGLLNVRSALQDVLKVNLSTASFEDAFPDLSDATKHLKSTALEDLALYLRDQANQEGQVVEMFGAKIPYDLVNVFGALLLVACQFYLWCHLVAFTTYVSNSSAKIDFTGYIGLYTERLAIRVFTLVSVSFIPVGVLALAIWKSRHSEWWEWIIPSIALPLSLLLGTLLVRGFLQLWSLKASCSNGSHFSDNVSAQTVVSEPILQNGKSDAEAINGGTLVDSDSSGRKPT